MRILIIGNEGAGKSVLANRMGRELGMPVTHLDMLAWTRTLRKLAEPVFRQRLDTALKSRDMIIEGWALQSTMRERLLWADLVIYLCFSPEFCLKSVARRSMEYNNRTYPYDLFEGNRQAQVSFYADLIARIHHEYEPEVQVWLKELEDKKMIYTYYSREDLEVAGEDMFAKIRKKRTSRRG